MEDESAIKEAEKAYEYLKTTLERGHLKGMASELRQSNFNGDPNVKRNGSMLSL